MYLETQDRKWIQVPFWSPFSWSFLEVEPLWVVCISTLISVLSPRQGSIAERAIPILFVQQDFHCGTQILFVIAPDYFSFWVLISNGNRIGNQGKVGPSKKGIEV